MMSGSFARNRRNLCGFGDIDRVWILPDHNKHVEARMCSPLHIRASTRSLTFKGQ
jgi:hypothetical protein